MNKINIRNLIRQVILEVKDEKTQKKENSLPKSGGKLVELKKELEGLRRMKESISQFSINENSSEPITVEYAHMQKFVNEINKIKEAHSKLSEMLDNQINEVESRMASETQKIKEMIGLAVPKEEKKAPSKKSEKKVATPSNKEEKKDESSSEDKKKSVNEERGDKGRQHSAKSRDYGLPYTPKTDYRVGQKFHHKEYGTGEIIKAEPSNFVAQSKDGAKLHVKFKDGNKIISVKTLSPDKR